MKIWGSWTNLAAFALSAASTHASDARFALPAPVSEIVTSAEQFTRFVAPVRAALPGANLDGRLQLGMQAHLALNDRDANAALAAAGALRALETDPAAKAVAGLMTEAQVAAWQTGTTLSNELATRLTKLPPSREVTGMLRTLREKIAATSRAALMADVKQLDERLAGSRHCGWTEADQIIRIRHRLFNVLPLKQAIVEALDEALAVRAID